MKRQLQGIALILLGILLALLDAAGGLWVSNMGYVGIAGAVIAFFPNHQE